MAKQKSIQVQGLKVGYTSIDNDEFISITDIAKLKNEKAPADVIKNWMRNKNTIELLGLWERLNNPNFKLVEFDQFKNEAGYNHFVLSPKKWIESTQAIGIHSKSGRYGGTYAHRDIALEFTSWNSVEFKFYLLKEFQRLKEQEHKSLDWNVKRSLTKINYRIHTDAVKSHLIPEHLSKQQINWVYATEADVLTMALYGMTAKQWRNQNPDKEGNIRDYSNVIQLVCLANLENLIAIWIEEGHSQSERLQRLNELAIQQMKLLTQDILQKNLKGGENE
ncbi:KilA-N domain-containing protein [Membranicola marinus]|uniref:KilA-N domain-containing protein n=1 Tax=Membranihabitans marinus TaxID=1227546 RepID=A0A953HZI5_9BACT|nr:KilA-N domain-containing protein [Membranihabitans marinus]MBY5958562.1 KilA-N domain-containing protein [Membranihabitans marinus]